MANYIKDRWNTNFKKWLEGNFNKLNGNEIDSTITELIKNFNSALSRFKSEGDFPSKKHFMQSHKPSHNPLMQSHKYLQKSEQQLDMVKKITYFFLIYYSSNFYRFLYDEIFAKKN